MTHDDAGEPAPLRLLEARLRRCPDYPVSLVSGLPDLLVERRDALPEWWLARGNRLFAREGAELPALIGHPGLPAPDHAVVILAGNVPPQQIMLWGSGSTVMLGESTAFPASTFHCGDGAIIAIGTRTVCTWNASVDARNGGSVVVGTDGLWATGVQVNSDDMHAIRDRSGRRINPFGGHIHVADKVWICYQALILNGARIGAGGVVGARSVVKATIPPASICVGSPARVVRSDISWTTEDLP